MIDAATNTLSATVNVGEEPRGIAVDPAGTYAYVANAGGAVSVINTATNAVSETVILCAAGCNPEGVAVNPAGSFVYVSNAGSGNLSVIDSTTNAVTATVGVGNNPRGVAVNPAGTYVYVANGRFLQPRLTAMPCRWWSQSPARLLRR